MSAENESSRREAPARAETREGYDRWAPTYDQLDNPMIAMTRLAMKRWAPRLDGRRVVELGCGTGRNAAFFLEAQCTEYVGVDGSEGMLAQARTRLQDERVRWIHGDVRTALAIGGFDLVFLSLVLEHAPAVVDVARVARAAAREGAELRIYELDAGLRNEGTQAHFREGERDVYLPSYAHDADEYRQGLTDAGWEIAAITEWHATREACVESAKLARYLGRPVILEVVARAV